MLLQEIPRVFPTLADALAFIAEPRPRFFNEVLCNSEVDQIALAGDAFTVKEVEFGFAKGRGNFIFHDFDSSPVADDGVAVFERADPPYFGANRGIKLQGAPSGRGFGIPEHDADLLADLIDE